MFQSTFKPKTTHHSTSVNRGKPSTTEAQQKIIAPSPVASSANGYPPDSAHALKAFNECLQHEGSQDNLSAISDVTSEFGGRRNHNDDWLMDTHQHQHPLAPKSDETDHLATIINLKMKLAQAHAENDKLALLLRQCMAEKTDLECKLRASIQHSSNTQAKIEVAYDRRHSAPMSFRPTRHIHRVHSQEHVLGTHTPMAWHGETLCTRNARQTKIDYVDKLMTQQFRG